MARRGFWLVWRAPMVLGALTTFGLIAALLGTGGWHWAAWLALAVIPAVSLLYGMRLKKP